MVVALLAASAHGERRKNSLPMDMTQTRGDHRGRLLFGFGGSAGGDTHVESYLRWFVHDRVTVGGRLRFGIYARAHELELGYSIAIGQDRLLGGWTRNDLIVLAGAGTNDGKALGFGGVGIRVHVRARSELRNAFAFELAARGTTMSRDPFVAEVALSALVTWPPVRRHRSCFGGYWR